MSVGRTWTEVSLYPLYLTGASNGQQTIRTSFDGKIITLPFSENTRRRPRSEKILQSIEDQNYKRGILFPISYFEKKEREISPLTALSESSQRAGPKQQNQLNSTLLDNKQHLARSAQQLSTKGDRTS